MTILQTMNVTANYQSLNSQWSDKTFYWLAEEFILSAKNVCFKWEYLLFKNRIMLSDNVPKEIRTAWKKQPKYWDI